MHIGFADVKPDRFRRVEGHNFEDLVAELAEHEVRLRHPGSVVAPPGPPSTGDGGRDALVSLVTPPAVGAAEFEHVLLPEGPADVCISAKSGDNWRDLVRRDVSRQPKPVEYVQPGHYYEVVLNKRCADTNKLRTEIATILAAREAQGGSPLAGKIKKVLTPDARRVREIAERVLVRDANDLARYVARHRPSLSPSFAEALGLREAPGTKTLTEWGNYLANDRSLPKLVSDDARIAGIAELSAAITARHAGLQVFWIHGSPGVGKSRFVFEALRASGATNRIIVASTLDSAESAVEGMEDAASLER